MKPHRFILLLVLLVVAAPLRAQTDDAAFLAKSGKTNEAAKLREEAQRL